MLNAVFYKPNPFLPSKDLRYCSAKKTKEMRPERRLTPYTPKESISKTVLFVVPIVALLAETQLAAYGINEERSSETSESNLAKTLKIIKTYLPFAYKFFGIFDIWHPAIEVLSATAILWSTANEVEEYGAFSGFLKGTGLHLFSFQVPVWLVPRVQNAMSGLFDNHHLFEGRYSAGRLLSGVFALLILESCVKLWDLFVIPFLEDGVAFIKNNIDVNSKAKVKEGETSVNSLSLPEQIAAISETENEVAETLDDKDN